jgi:hypothetical protein
MLGSRRFIEDLDRAKPSTVLLDDQVLVVCLHLTTSLFSTASPRGASFPDLRGSSDVF